MMKNNIFNPLKALAVLVVALGAMTTISCKEDGPECDTETTFYADADGDGLGSATETQLACEQPEGYVDNANDWDDAVASNTQSIYDIVAAIPALDSLQKYLEVYPDLIGLLDAPGTATLFAPDNAAFVSLLATPGFPSSISSINPDIIKNVLAYHVSLSLYKSENLTAGTTVPTASLGNELITVTSQGNLGTGSSNPQIEIGVADIMASNGVVHITKSVLIPPTVGLSLTPILGTNAGTLLLGTPFSVLALGIMKADTFATMNTLPTLVSVLANPNSTMTVFAPTNETFIAAAIKAGIIAENATPAEQIAGAKAFIAATPAQSLYGIIAHHVVVRETTIAPSELVTGAQFTTVANKTLTIFNNTAIVPAKNGTGIYIDSNGNVDVTLSDGGASLANLDAEVVAPNAVENPNGTIHVIAGLLVPAN